MFQSGQIFEIFASFIAILSYSTSDKLSYYQIEIVEKCCEHILGLFDRVFGETFFTSNVHDINHYSFFLKEFGCFYNYSLFPYEEMNRKLINFLSGQRNPQKQMATAFYFQNKIELRSNRINSGTDIFSHFLPLSLQKVNESTSYLGYIDRGFNINSIQNVDYRFTEDSFIVYKILYKDIFINSTEYNSKYGKKLNNYFLKISDIDSTTFIKVFKIIIDGSRVFVFGELYEVTSFLKIGSLNMLIENYMNIASTGRSKLLEIDDKEILVLVLEGDRCIEPPNNFEKF